MEIIIWKHCSALSELTIPAFSGKSCICWGFLNTQFLAHVLLESSCEETVGRLLRKVEHCHQFVPELRPGQAVDYKVDGAVNNHKKSCCKVKKISFLLDVIIKIVFIAQLYWGQLGHFYQTQDKAGTVQDQEDKHQHHHHLRQLEFTSSPAFRMEELPWFCHVWVDLEIKTNISKELLWIIHNLSTKPKCSLNACEICIMMYNIMAFLINYLQNNIEIYQKNKQLEECTKVRIEKICPVFSCSSDHVRRSVGQSTTSFKECQISGSNLVKNNVRQGSRSVLLVSSQEISKLLYLFKGIKN